MRAEEALHAFAEVLRADQERLGVFGVGLDEADGGAGRESGEEVFGVVFGEVLAAVEIEHGSQNTTARAKALGAKARLWLWRCGTAEAVPSRRI